MVPFFPSTHVGAVRFVTNGVYYTMIMMAMMATLRWNKKRSTQRLLDGRTNYDFGVKSIHNTVSRWIYSTHWRGTVAKIAGIFSQISSAIPIRCFVQLLASVSISHLLHTFLRSIEQRCSLDEPQLHLEVTLYYIYNGLAQHVYQRSQ